jgi:transcriptional regulator with XRE-family HTH domain
MMGTILKNFSLIDHQLPRLEEHKRKVIGDRLYQLRTEKKLSQYILGLLVGVNRSTIAAWESGERDMRTIYKMVFAHFFNVDEKYLWDHTHTDRGSHKKDTLESFVRDLDNAQRERLFRIYDQK